MRRILGVLLLFCFTQTGFAKKDPVDSLTQALKTCKTDSACCCIAERLAHAYSNIEPVKGFPVARKGLFYAKRSKIRKYESDLYNSIGLLHRLVSSYDSSLYYHHKALDLCKKYNLDLPRFERAYSFLNLTYTEQGNFAAGLEYGFKFLRLIERGKDSLRTALAYNNIANTYFGIDKYEKAVFYYKKALVIARKLNHAYGICLLTLNIGSVYYAEQQYDSSMQYFRRSLNMALQLGDQSSIAITYSNIADCFDKEKSDSALHYFSKAIDIYEKLNMRAELAGAYNNISIVYHEADRYAQSINYAKKALAIGIEIKSLAHQKESYEALYKAYDALNDKSNAYLNFKEWVKIKDSLSNEELRKNEYKAEIDYEYDMKKYADSLQQQKVTELGKQRLKAEKDKSAWRQTLVYVALIALALMLCLSLFIYKGYRDKNAANKLISEQQRQTERQKLEIEQKNSEILDSINYAKRIQEAILPSTRAVNELFPENFILYRPKDIVAGDFYWLDKMNGKIMLAAGDCTGHGVPGAMVSVVCHNALNRSLREFNLQDPGKLLDKTRELVIEHFSHAEQEVKDGMDIALCVFTLNNQGAELEFAGANNPLWIIRKDSREVEEVRPDKQPIGSYAEPKPFTTQKVLLNKGDQIYIFTDGYADQFGGEKGKKLKASNFKSLLAAVSTSAMREQCVKIDQAYDTWKGSLEQIDDVCVIGVRV